MLGDGAEQREAVARAIWDAMVSDEVPDDRTLEEYGYFDGADAAIAALGPCVPVAEVERVGKQRDAALRQVDDLLMALRRAVSPKEGSDDQAAKRGRE
jgi:hypothetical protein